jgi:hypothetical protein
MSGHATRLRLAPLLAILALSACASVLGIEDIQEDPELANGGTDTTSGAQAGTQNSGGSTPTTANGGNTAAAGNAATGGSSPGAGTTAIGEGGMGGGANPGDPTVHGKVIDFWGKALPGVPVQIGEEQVVTDDKGEFTFENVPAEYDASLVVRPKNPAKDLGWVYQGLTRRDPTLQVYEAREEREANVLVKVTNVTLGENDQIAVAFGTPDGSTVNSGVSDAPGGYYATPDWVGATSTSGTVHALLWSNNNATTLPSAYTAYQSRLIALDDTVEGAETFDLTPVTQEVGTVSGSATPASTDARKNMVFVRFSSSASIQVVDQTDAPNTFSYLVPKLANASITVAAREGPSDGPTGLVHADGLSPGGNAVVLDIPAPAEPLSPVGGSANSVTKDTTFTFKGSPDSKGAFVVWMENTSFQQTLYIVTSKTSFKIPVVAGGIFELDPAQTFRWRVETHGSFATVDEMTGASGFMDAFSFNWSAPMGPKQESGSFTMSGAYGFTTAP